MTKHPPQPWWRKILSQIVPLVIASSVWWLVTGVGNTIDHHVAVTVHVR